jgi:V/A-type H+-transporting ATPase subunit I
MAVEKMKLLSITGKDTDLEKFLAKNIINLDIQIEDAKKVYKKGWKLEYFSYDYTVKEYIKKCEKVLDELQIEKDDDYWNYNIINSVSEIKEKIDNINNQYTEYINKIVDLEKENELMQKNYDIIKNLVSVDSKIENLYNLKYMKFRYGTVPTKNLEEINRKIDNTDAIYFELKREEEYTWILYLTTEEFLGKVDSFFNVQDFERIWLPKEASGTPEEFINQIEKNIKENLTKIDKEKEELRNLRIDAKEILIGAYKQLLLYENVNILKKYIVHDQNGTFYIVLWVSKDNAENIKSILSNYKNVDYDIFDDDEDIQAPTKLKNIKIFRPFETLIKMYGVPNSKEIDPTGLVAITAFIMFGFMFGDVGHGLVIFILGLILAKRKASLGPVLAIGGISSIIFGVLYGSVFGKEDIIKPILISPMDNIQTMLISGIAVGSIFILIAMIFNIINGIKNKDLQKCLFDKNGISGFLLYGLILADVAVYFLKGQMLIPINVIVIVSIILILLILFGDTISSKLEKKKEQAKTPMVEKIFEIIEMTLSFASNTISFLRLAAFAINHVGLCMAVYLLADMSSGVGNIAIAIIGNIVVIALEGLIVGIQVLRLEYYELFSRFYEGNGREFKSIKKQIQE